jgi:hypothetical protein
MTHEENPPIAERLANHQLITKAIGRGVRAALLRSAREGLPVSTLRDGQVVWLQPAEILALLAAPDNGPANGEPKAQ